jgi:hypothetical protein
MTNPGDARKHGHVSLTFLVSEESLPTLLSVGQQRFIPGVIVEQNSVIKDSFSSTLYSIDFNRGEVVLVAKRQDAKLERGRAALAHLPNLQIFCA